MARRRAVVSLMGAGVLAAVAGVVSVQALQVAPALASAGSPSPSPSPSASASASPSPSASTSASTSLASGCALPAGPVLTSAPGTGKTVALTFDDGPGSYSTQVLEVLRRKGVHATFFVIGNQVGAGADTLRAQAAGGHQVAGHSWDHRYPSEVAWTPRHLSDQLRATSGAVRAATGRRGCWFRPPGGFTSGVSAAVRAEGMRAVLWSVDPQDWRTQQRDTAYGPTAQGIYRRALSTSAHPIVLMHDGGGLRGATVAALPHVIDWYRARGYRFVRIDGD
jgi:peptidoglycan-N-acetylglucosamine deacetylase